MKRILTVQDISCVGRCSLTVALPIISAAGVEAGVLPTAVLSTHTMFPKFTFCDLTDEIEGISKTFSELDIGFDAIYTGYLGSIKQVGYVRDILKTMGTDDCVRVVDPAMADNGQLYSIFDQDYVEAMKVLCGEADILVPNITEACILTDEEYKEVYDESYICTLVKKLKALGAKTIVLTGVSYESGKTGVIVYENGKMEYYKHDKIAKGSHGTGDIYASAFVGALMNDKSVYESAKIAADYTVKCIINTQGDADHWYGAKFETALGDLMKTLA